MLASRYCSQLTHITSSNRGFSVRHENIHRPASIRRVLRPVAAASGSRNEGGFGKFMKQVRDGLPVVGLISRLTTPEGIDSGKEIPTYNEFCRSYLENAPAEFNTAMIQLEKSGTTQTAQRRFVMICVWMCKYGAGILSDSFLAKAGLRLPITRDIEAEMDRFDMDRTKIVSKYPLMEPPQPNLPKGAVLAVDAVASCCYGVSQADALPEGANAHIVEIVSTVFKEVSREDIEEAVQSRASRTYA